MKLGVILTLGFLAIASLVGLVGYLYSVTGEEVELQISQLRRSSIIEVIGAGEMRLALQANQVAAQQVVGERYRALVEPDHETGSDLDLETPTALIEDGLDEFEKRLRSSWEASQAAVELAQRRGDAELADREREGAKKWLVRLEKEFAVHESLTDRFLHLAAYHPSEEVDEYLQEVLEPHYQNEMLPLIRAYEKEAEGALAAELAAMEEAHVAANRRNLVVAGIALLGAIALGLITSRSISRPLAALREAAREVGRGNLDTRIELASRNEIGILARTFNQMVGDLEASTISRSYLDKIIQSMRDMLIVGGPDGTIRMVNRVTLEELGYREEELLGRPLSLLTDPGSSPTELPLPSEGSRPPGSGEQVFLTRRGDPIPVSCSRSDLRGEDGDLEGVVWVAQNIAERKQAEARLRGSLEEKEVLLKEVHHRVKNNLQIISSLLNLKAREERDPQAHRRLRESRNRIRSMALVHEQLYKSKDLAHIDFAEYVERLIQFVSQSYGPERRGVRVRLDIDPTPLSVDRAIPCGMILHELVANAIEHAFPDGRGEIRVEFRSAEGRHRLSVLDDGVGLPDGLDPGDPPTLGFRLITALAEQLGGTLELEAGAGTRLAVSFAGPPSVPAPPLVEA